MDCCKCCNDRIPGCHTDCIKYIAQKVEFDEQQRKIREHRHAESDIRLARNDGIRRMMRKD